MYAASIWRPSGIALDIRTTPNQRMYHQNLYFEINSFIVKLGAYVAARRRHCWPHLPAVMSPVANDIWGAAVLRRMASSIHTQTSADPLGNERVTNIHVKYACANEAYRMPGSISMALREGWCVSVYVLSRM